MSRLPANEARKNLSEALNRVAFGNERIILQRRGKDVAALVPLEDLELLEELEDRLDLEDAIKAFDEKEERIPLAEAKRRLYRKK